MSFLVRDCPYFLNGQEPFYLSGPGNAVRSVPYVVPKSRQLIVRVSLTASQSDPWTPSTIGFPAVVDTGFNGGFLLTTYHLETWARQSIENLGERLKNIPVRGLPAASFRSHVWVRKNIPGAWDESHARPTRLDCEAGIILVREHPTGSGDLPGTFPLPLLGMEALESPRVKLTVDAAKRQFTLRDQHYWRKLFKFGGRLKA